MTEKQGSIAEWATVKLSKDKMTAVLEFSRLDENASCSAQQLQALLKQNQVIYGINHDLLIEIEKNPQAFSNQSIVIARGDLPEEGAPGYIQEVVGQADAEKRPRELEGGKVDFREIAKLNNVIKGQLIAKKIPPGTGKPGMTVTGEVVEGKPGREAHFKLGKNVVTDSEKMNLYAAIDGLVTKTENDKINVFPVYEVSGDVDYRVGNIDFVGNVVIRGNVLPGFKVKASGDIRVVGGVESAELVAGGSIEITEGILGHGKGIVQAGKNVTTSFIQDGNVVAGEEVRVTQSIMHSHVQAGKSVYCEGGNGLIVGGTIQAGDKVAARTIGNAMATVTVIEVGVQPQLRNELAELKKKMKLLRENLDKTKKALAILDQLVSAGQIDREKMAMRVKLINTKNQTEEEEQETKARIMEIESILENSLNATVAVHSVIYMGTKVSIGRYTKYIKDSAKRVLLRIADGDIVMTALD